jgi:hypothetical protein
MYNIEVRRHVEVNTDPQRRCYNGCHASSEIQVTSWEVLVSAVEDNAVESKLKFWRELNDYAVSQRGASAKKEFRVVECV